MIHVRRQTLKCKVRAGVTFTEGGKVSCSHKVVDYNFIISGIVADESEIQVLMQLVSFKRQLAKKKRNIIYSSYCFPDSLGKLVHYLRPRRDKVTLQIHWCCSRLLSLSAF